MSNQMSLSSHGMGSGMNGVSPPMNPSGSAASWHNIPVSDFQAADGTLLSERVRLHYGLPEGTRWGPPSAQKNTHSPGFPGYYGKKVNHRI